MNLKLFSRINLQRCISKEGFNHPLDGWSLAEWTNAIAGEIGEACNNAKKLLRHRDGIKGNLKSEDQDVFDLQYRTAKEIADAIIYADLAIQALGFETSAMIETVFNAKSLEMKCPIEYKEE